MLRVLEGQVGGGMRSAREGDGQRSGPGTAAAARRRDSVGPRTAIVEDDVLAPAPAASHAIKTKCLRGRKVDIPEWARHDEKEKDMPQIIVTADRGAAFGEGAVTFRERVNVADFDSEHFAAQLVERVPAGVEGGEDLERVPAVEGGEEMERVPAAVEGGEEMERVREEEPVTAPSRA
jgi:hypothetical protein